MGEFCVLLGYHCSVGLEKYCQNKMDQRGVQQGNLVGRKRPRTKLILSCWRSRWTQWRWHRPWAQNDTGGKVRETDETYDRRERRQKAIFHEEVCPWVRQPNDIPISILQHYHFHAIISFFRRWPRSILPLGFHYHFYVCQINCGHETLGKVSCLHRPLC